MTPKPSKKTLYIDVDEEITGIIDKVRSVEESIVALVIPKRAAVFSSIVNLKLLKRAASQNGKKVVLVTSDQSILPLAGIVGLHAAANLNSKPYLPKPPVPADEKSEASEEPIEVDSAGGVAVAAAAAGMAAGSQVADEVPSIEVDSPKTDDKAAETAKKAKKTSKSKLKVPNFNRFRALLIGGIIGLIVLIVGGYWALAIAPKATVTITGETDQTNLAFAVKADTAAKSLDEDGAVVPSLKKEIKKTETERVPATGQKDKGNKASGKVELRNCTRSDGSVNIPAGTGISSSGLTFIIQEAVTLEPSEFTGGGTCKSDTKEVAVIAQDAGDRFNVDSRSYTVAGFAGVTAQGSSMTGGTSQIVKVVSASDIESAKTKLSQKEVGAREELKSALNAEGYIGLVDTFATAPGQYVATPAVDSESSEVAVSVQITYSMVGMKKDDLQKLIKVKAEKQANIDLSKQSILDDGLGSATYQLGAVKATVTDVNVNTNIVTGPEINQDSVKQEIAGKKRGEAEQILKSRPGIKEVRIDTSPFWNYSVPKKQQKIQIVIQDNNDTQTQP